MQIEVFYHAWQLGLDSGTRCHHRALAVHLARAGAHEESITRRAHHIEHNRTWEHIHEHATM
jgi:hypothetical protein